LSAFVTVKGSGVQTLFSPALKAMHLYHLIQSITSHFLFSTNSK